MNLIICELIFISEYLRVRACACVCMRVHACACVCMSLHACARVCTRVRARVSVHVVIVHCSVLQCIEVCCNVLQWVAVCVCMPPFRKTLAGKDERAHVSVVEKKGKMRWYQPVCRQKIVWCNYWVCVMHVVSGRMRVKNGVFSIIIRVQHIALV